MRGELPARIPLTAASELSVPPHVVAFNHPFWSRKMSKRRRSLSMSETRLGKFEQLERRQMLSLATSFVGPIQPTKLTTPAVTSTAGSIIVPSTDISRARCRSESC